MSNPYFSSIEEIEAWKKGCRLAVDILECFKHNASSCDPEISVHIKNAAIGIPVNISKGFERGGKTDFARYFLNARGSCGELITLLYISRAANFINKAEFNKLYADCMDLISIITGSLKEMKVKADLDKAAVD